MVVVKENCKRLHSLFDGIIHSIGKKKLYSSPKVNKDAI